MIYKRYLALSGVWNKIDHDKQYSPSGGKNHTGLEKFLGKKSLGIPRIRCNFH
jgi:hypothetical protein